MLGRLTFKRLSGKPVSDKQLLLGWVRFWGLQATAFGAQAPAFGAQAAPSGVLGAPFGDWGAVFGVKGAKFCVKKRFSKG